MSLLLPIARLLLREHHRKPITGDVLTIGRQTIPMSHREAETLFSTQGVDPREVVPESDTETVGANPIFINDKTFGRMLGVRSWRSLDNSGYEGADIIHDMNVPWAGDPLADFVFDGSCLDNLFDPACAMKNMSRLLRPGGRLMLFEHGTPIQSAYICYSPAWFYDFFIANGYRDIQIFVGKFKGVLDEWEISTWWSGMTFDGRDFITVAIAEKGADSTDDKTPIQGHYRMLQDGVGLVPALIACGMA